MSRHVAISAGIAAVVLAFGLGTPVLAAGDLAAAKAVVAAHTTLPTFVPPGEPFDARKAMAGKKILTIPVSSANPFTKNITLAMIDVAKQLGFEVVEWENQARPTQWVQGIEYAINNKFDAVDFLGGVDPAVLGPQIEQAKEAGVQDLRVASLRHDPDARPQRRSVAADPLQQSRRHPRRLGRRQDAGQGQRPDHRFR